MEVSFLSLAEVEEVSRFSNFELVRNRVADESRSGRT